MMLRKAVFLDRDGTINVDHGYVSRIDQWQFLEGALDALRSLSNNGYALAVVTNQSGIARGYYSAAEVHALHEHMINTAAQHGVTFDAIAYCPHGPDENCSCRKPGTQMNQQIEEQLDYTIGYPNSWTIGDKTSDFAFGTTLGTHTALLTSPYWSPNELTQQPDIIADSLQEAASQILSAKHQILSKEGAAQ